MFPDVFICVEEPSCSVSHIHSGPYVRQESYDLSLSSTQFLHFSILLFQQINRPQAHFALEPDIVPILWLHYISALSHRPENKGPDLSLLRGEFHPNNNEILFFFCLYWSPSIRMASELLDQVSIDTKLILLIIWIGCSLTAFCIVSYLNEIRDVSCW